MQIFLVLLGAFVSHIVATPMDGIFGHVNQSMIMKYLISRLHTLHDIEDLRISLFEENMNLANRYTKNGYFRGFVTGLSSLIDIRSFERAKGSSHIQAAILVMFHENHAYDHLLNPLLEPSSPAFDIQVMLRMIVRRLVHHHLLFPS